MNERNGEAVTVSIVVRDSRGFTHHYADFSTNPRDVQRVLELLAGPQTSGPQVTSFGSDPGFGAVSALEMTA